METKKSRLNKIIKQIMAISFSLFFTCFFILFYEAVKNNKSIPYIMEDESVKESFEDTSDFQALIKEFVEKTIRYVVICDQFETDGEFDRFKEIDIFQYATRKELGKLRIPRKVASYYLDDLINWGKSGVELYFADYNEYEQMYNDAKLSPEFNNDTTTTTTNNNNNNFVVEYDFPHENNNKLVNILLDELYYPTDQSPLILHSDTFSEFAQHSEYLQETVEDISYNFEQYQKLSQVLKESNFKYYIAYFYNSDWQVYTNCLNGRVINRNATLDEINQYFLNNGRYIYCNYDNLTAVSNIGVSPEVVWNEINDYYYAYPNSNIRMWFGVDTDYLVKDIFSKYKESYTDSFNIFRVIVMLGTAFGLISLIMLVVLSLKEPVISEKIRTIDHLKTEIIMLIGLGSIAFFMFVTLKISDLLKDYMYFNTFIGYGIDKFITIMCLMGVSYVFINYILHIYLAFIRRTKKNELLKESIIKSFYDICVYTFYHPRILIRTLIPYIGFTVINIVLILNIITVNFAFIFPTVILNLYVGYKLFKSNKMRISIMEGIKQIQNGNLDHKINLEFMRGDNLMVAEAINEMGDGIKLAVESSMKDEKMKADIITNVSHDIKTPLTSIISYIDLIKREQIDNEKVLEYVNILDAKSQRLKQLTDDLVEASKISSGNISLVLDRIDLVQMIIQAEGEFEEKFEDHHLNVVIEVPDEPVYILADSRRIWRIFENLFTNIIKYAMKDTRVYISLNVVDDEAQLSFKNISSEKLELNANDLTERFIRGDASRSTEGSGLGLFISKSLTQLLGGKFDVYLDGDLFKVIISFSIDK